MNKDELKLRIIKTAEELIDTYFAENTIIDKMANGTMKILLAENHNKIDNFLVMFCDSEGQIDADKIITTYANQIDNNGLKFDIKDYIHNDFVKSILPDKSLLISKDDILKIIKPENVC